MAKVAEVERQVLKAVGEAETALRGLEKDLRKLVKLYQKHALDPVKVKVGVKRITAFIKKQGPVLRLQDSDVVGALSNEAQSGLLWLDTVVNDLNNLQGRLNAAVKLSKKDPDTAETRLVKTTRELGQEIRQPPRGVGVLVKEIKKGMGPGDFAGFEFSILPMVLLFWMIADTIHRNLSRR